MVSEGVAALPVAHSCSVGQPQRMLSVPCPLPLPTPPCRRLPASQPQATGRKLVGALTQADTAPHQLVCLEITADWLEVFTTKLVASPKLPRARAIGPSRKGPSSNQAKRLALADRKAATISTSRWAIERALHRAVNAWSQVATQEVLLLTPH